MSKELLTRIRATCGRFPVWSEFLGQRLSRARRCHKIKSISMSIQSPVHSPILPISPPKTVSPPEMCHNSSSNSSFISTAFTTPLPDSYYLKILSKSPTLMHDGTPDGLLQSDKRPLNSLQSTFGSEKLARVPSCGSTQQQAGNNLPEFKCPNNFLTGEFDGGLSDHMDLGEVLQIENQKTTSWDESSTMLRLSSDAEDSRLGWCSISESAPFYVQAWLPSGSQADTSGTMAFGRALPQYDYCDHNMLSALRLYNQETHTEPFPHQI